MATSSYTPEQFARLPKWAQTEIQRLTSNLASMERERDEILGNDAESNTHIVEGIETRGLPNNAWLRFRLDGEWPNHIDVTVRGDELRINGQGAVDIHPEASNAFSVRLRTR